MVIAIWAAVIAMVMAIWAAVMAMVMAIQAAVMAMVMAAAPLTKEGTPPPARGTVGQVSSR